MRYHGINHIGLVVTDLDRASEFYVKTIGLQHYPKRKSWLTAGRVWVHLIEIPEAGTDGTLYHAVGHAAFQVDDVREILGRLLKSSYSPFQMDFEGNEMPVDDPSSPLDFGIGTLFVRDPDANLIEFLEIGRGEFRNEPDPFT